MITTHIASAARLSNRDLLQRVSDLASREREATVELIAHLAELDKRKLHRAEGFGSLFRYCREVLRLSEQAAYKRILAARSCRRYPVVLDRLVDGSLNLSTLCLLARHLTPENHDCVLAEAAGRSKREVEVLVARLWPEADVRASIRKLPERARTAAVVTPLRPAVEEGPSAIPAAALGEATGTSLSGRADAQSPHARAATPMQGATGMESSVSRPAGALAPRPVVAPLSSERYRVQFTIGKDAEEKLRRVQDLLRREIPDGDLAAIFERALTLLLHEVARKKLAATSRPRPHRGDRSPRSRHIPAQLKRAVLLRDGDQCTFVAPNGRGCRERTFLEFHHIVPWALGGETTLENVTLRCRDHNAYEAELVFGPSEPIVRETPGLYMVH